MNVIKSCKINKWLPSAFKFYQIWKLKNQTNLLILDFYSFEINLKKKIIINLKKDIRI